MELEEFFDNFDTIAQAPGGVQRLRELILDLAVRGKLVPQDPNDEPASELLGRIAARLKPLAKELGARFQPFSFDADKVPFELPTGWSWSCLGALGPFLGGGTPSKRNDAFWGGSIPWVSPKDMKVDYIGDVRDAITDEAVRGSSVKLIPTGSLLMVLRGMILAHSFPVAITTKPVTINQDMKALILEESGFGDFMLKCLQGMRFRFLELVQRSSHGTCRMPTEDMATFPLAIPPLAEQERIVAKVDELMGLCDELEKRQTHQLKLRDRWRASALDALMHAESDASLEHAWAHIRDNWSYLTDHPDGIDALRQAILQLAVRGKLVEQDPKDEPASELLEQIEDARRFAFKEKQVANHDKKRSKKYKAAPLLTDDVLEDLPSLPNGWEWSALSRLAQHIVDGTHHTPKYVDQGVDFISAKNIIARGIVFEGCRQISQEEYEKLILRCNPKRGDLLVTKSGSIGRVAMVETDHDFTLFESVALVPLVGPINHQYVAYVVEFKAGGAFGRKMKKGMAVKHLHLKDLRLLPIPLPPLAEQERIVAKVDEMMEMCDRLETHLRRSYEVSEALAAAAVHHLAA